MSAKAVSLQGEGSALEAKSVGEAEQGEVVRFCLNQRVQHMILLSTFLVLSATGLALKYHDNWFAALIIRLEGGMEMRGLIHRGAALVLMGLCLYHIFYIMFSRWGHEEFLSMKPRLKDLADFYRALKFNIGLGGDYPQFEKYNYKEKFQYYGVATGAAIMVASGLILWFENQSLAVMPKWSMDLISVIHGNEGLLAFLVLFIWHLYNVHINPDVFPMNTTWWTGKMSLGRLKESHYLEYLKISRTEAK